jgi:hypothetical protein
MSQQQPKDWSQAEGQQLASNVLLIKSSKGKKGKKKSSLIWVEV